MGTALSNILKELRKPKYQHLSTKEERYYYERYKNGDETAREILVNSKLRLVVSIAREYLLPGIPMEDLFQEGSIGLMKSLDHFNPDLGSLYAYSSLFIRAEIRKLLAREYGALSLNNSIVALTKRVLRFINVAEELANSKKENQLIDHLQDIREMAMGIEIHIQENEHVSQYDPLYLDIPFLAKKMIAKEAYLAPRPIIKAARNAQAAGYSLDRPSQESEDEESDEPVSPLELWSFDPDPDEVAYKLQFYEALKEARDRMTPEEWKTFKLRHGLRDSNPDLLGEPEGEIQIDPSWRSIQWISFLDPHNSQPEAQQLCRRAEAKLYEVLEEKGISPPPQFTKT